jgi:thiol-disulfide isomerase/thioredoxin
MLRKIFILIALVCGFNAMAQDVKNPIKPTVPEPKPDYRVIGAPLPNVLVITYDSIKTEKKKKHRKQVLPQGPTKIVTNKDIDDNHNLIVMIFNPTCGHCEEMTHILTNSEDRLQKSKVLMLAAPVMRPYMPDFIKNQKLGDHPNFIIGIDSLDVNKDLYLYSALPQLNIYDANRKLVKIFSGEVAIDSVINYLHKP